MNFILKEAYKVIPFAIKPSNITDAMNKNFKFKKGILFQRFLIAAESFNSSSLVDHCAAVTTIQETVSEDIDAAGEATTLIPDVKLTMLPMNCLWSPWSEWTECSTSCGRGMKERQRSVVLQELNGGSCPGRFKEFLDCEEEECNEEVTTMMNINNITGTSWVVFTVSATAVCSHYVFLG